MSSPVTTIPWITQDTKSLKDPTSSALFPKQALNSSPGTAPEQLMHIKPASLPMMMIKINASMKARTSLLSVLHGLWIK